MGLMASSSALGAGMGAGSDALGVASGMSAAAAAQVKLIKSKLREEWSSNALASALTPALLQGVVDNFSSLPPEYQVRGRRCTFSTVCSGGQLSVWSGVAWCAAILSKWLVRLARFRVRH